MALKDTFSTPLSRQIWPDVGPALWGVVLLSSIINVLMFAGPLFMLQVYDRVLTSRSLETLAALSLGLLGIFVVQAWFDMRRDRLVSRMGSLIDARLSQPVVDALVRFSAAGAPEADAARPAKDQDQIRQFMTSKGPETLADLPWMPLFLVACFVLHPWIGFLTLAGAVVLFAIGVFAERAARSANEAYSSGVLARNTLSAAIRRNADASAAMGMARPLTARYLAHDDANAAGAQAAHDTHGAWLAWSRAARLALQSAVLGLGAVLVILNEMNAGAMIAASILTGRALQPAEQAIAHWSSFAAARQAFERLGRLPSLLSSPDVQMRPAHLDALSIQGLAIMTPVGRGALSGVSLSLCAGDVLGVIGPSGSGKTSLAKAVAGVWPPARGEIKLDGLPASVFPRAAVGYLPQDASLFDDTVASNIARMTKPFDIGAVVAAAKAAGAHEMIMALPQGYDTRIGGNGGGLSSGQKQRIGLARALFGEPALVVLDEPNANLDSDGEIALARAIQGLKSRGAIVLLIAHRSKILGLCDKLLVLSQGSVQAFGPRAQVLGQLRQRRIEDPVVLLGATQSGKPL
jgi:PrtD family type I secretion system ABC transporter